MPHYSTWGADGFRFTVSGPGAQRLFALAAGQGVPLRAVHCTGDGYAALARGRDRSRLEAIAARGGWRMCILGRRGPGRAIERFMSRPGLLVGVCVFVFLVHWLSGFVWAMDFSGLDGAQEQQLRAMLAQNGIMEGSWLPQTVLAKAQTALSLQNGQFGWLSLNFTGGCLFVEDTPLERQPIHGDEAGIALYAKADAQILRVEVDSGFAAVVPGQYVREGQLLAANARLDRDGGPVTQSASGRIWARVTRTYTAEQPLSTKADVLDGPSRERVTFYLFGHALPQQTPEMAVPANALCTARWQPLQIGRVCLPACLFAQTVWPRSAHACRYSVQQAAALAKRACRLQLEAGFPGAKVEQQQLDVASNDGKAVATVRYTFQADIAQAMPGKGEALPQN